MKLRYKIITIVNVVHRNTELSQNDALVHIYTMVSLRETNTITNRYMYRTQKNWQYKQQVYSHLIFRTILVFLPSLIKETLKKWQDI